MHGLPVEVVQRLAESVEPVGEVDTLTPGRRLAAASPPGNGPRWLVEWSSRLPGFDELPCYTVWIEGQVLEPTCGAGPPEGDRLVVALVDGDPGRGPSTWRFLDAADRDLGSVPLDLGEVGG